MIYFKNLQIEENMYQNNVNCDLYIGQGAGKKLWQELYKAEQSIKIVSPYLSPSSVSQLIKIQEKGIEVSLITTDEIEDYKDPHKSNMSKLIIQYENYDENAEHRKNRIRSYIYLFIGLTLISLLLMGYLFLSEIQTDLKAIAGLLSLLFIGVSFFLKNTLKAIRAYSYTYDSLFKLKVICSKESSSFVHSKIYIIDDKIAYLGSMNLTYKGGTSNLETRVRTQDTNAVSKITEEFETIFFKEDLVDISIDHLGKKVYEEYNF